MPTSARGPGLVECFGFASDALHAVVLIVPNPAIEPIDSIRIGHTGSQVDVVPVISALGRLEVIRRRCGGAQKRGLWRPKTLWLGRMTRGTKSSGRRSPEARGPD